MMQSQDLQWKIQVTTTRVIGWYEYFGGDVYIVFSDGKDSTVLLNIVRRIYPDVPAVFCDTGLKFPEIREFVKQYDNTMILRPGMNFRKVTGTYGYPAVSRRVAGTVEYGSRPGFYRWKELHREIIRSNSTPSELNRERWCYLLGTPFKVSPRYCSIMKKEPLGKYFKGTGRVPIIAIMADESRSRRSVWTKQGCNAFSKKSPSSQPMSFWIENDIFKYLHIHNIPHTSVYGKIIPCGREVDNDR